MSPQPTAYESETEHGLAKTYLAQAPFVTFDLDAISVVGFDNLYFVNCLLSQPLLLLFRIYGVNAYSVQ